MRGVAKTFRFVIPGHVLTSLLLLGLAASDLWDKSPESAALRHEARFFEVLLPLVACLFVFGSIPKQMKNFLATGLLFLAIGIVRLEQDLFKEHAAWPLSLLVDRPPADVRSRQLLSPEDDPHPTGPPQALTAGNCRWPIDDSVQFRPQIVAIRY